MGWAQRLATSLTPRKSGLAYIKRLTYLLVKEREDGSVEKMLTTEDLIPLAKERR